MPVPSLSLSYVLACNGSCIIRNSVHASCAPSLSQLRCSWKMRCVLPVYGFLFFIYLSALLLSQQVLLLLLPLLFMCLLFVYKYLKRCHSNSAANLMQIEDGGILLCAQKYTMIFDLLQNKFVA